MVHTIRNTNSAFFVGSSKNASAKFLYQIIKVKSRVSKSKIKVFYRDEMFAMRKDLEFVPDIAVEWNDTTIAIDVVDKNFSYSTEASQRVQECADKNIVYQIILDASAIGSMTEMMFHNLLKATQKPVVVANGTMSQIGYLVDAEGRSSASLANDCDALVCDKEDIGLKKSFGLIIKQEEIPEVVVYEEDDLLEESSAPQYSDYDGSMIETPTFWYPTDIQNGKQQYVKMDIIIPFTDDKEKQHKALSRMKESLEDESLLDNIVKNVSYWKYYGYFRWVYDNDTITLPSFHSTIRGHTMKVGATVHPSPMDCKNFLDYLSEQGILSKSEIGRWNVQTVDENFNPRDLLDFI